MAELLPGRTAVVVRREEPHLEDLDIRFPCLVLGERQWSWQWLYRSGLYFFKLNTLSPVQVRVERYLRQHGVKIVLSEFLNASLKWLDVAQKLGIRFFAHAHGHDVSAVLREPGMTQRYRRLEAADGVITVSQHSRDKLVRIGLSGDNIHVVPCGTDVPETPRSRPRRASVRCLAVGRMVAKKAPMVTLEAFRQALRSNPDLRLDYVGGGEFFDDAREFVRTHGLHGQVTLHGSQPKSRVQKFMETADIFLQHSRTVPVSGDEEGIPVAILEAMANSLPVVSTRHAGIPEAVLEGATGYLVDEGDAETMASHVVGLANDYELRTRFGRKGWLRAKQHFSWESERDRLSDILGLGKLNDIPEGPAL